MTEINWTTGVDPGLTLTLDEVVISSTLTGYQTLIMVNASSGGITITLPAAASHTDRVYIIKKIDSSGNVVTIDANGSETIDGETKIELTLQYQYVTIVCDGDEWFIIGGEYVKMEDILRDILSLEEKDKKLLEDILKQLKKINS